MPTQCLGCCRLGDHQVGQPGTSLQLRGADVRAMAEDDSGRNGEAGIVPPLFDPQDILGRQPAAVHDDELRRLAFCGGPRRQIVRALKGMHCGQVCQAELDLRDPGVIQIGHEVDDIAVSIHGSLEQGFRYGAFP